MITLALIASDATAEIIGSAIEKVELNCRIIPRIYQDIADLPKIYEACKGECDGILLGGEIIYHYMINHVSDIELPVSFVFYDTPSILSVFLDFVLNYPTIPLNRVYADFLTPKNNFMDMKKYIVSEFMPQCFEGDIYDYPHIIAHAKKLIEENKIDMILTRCTGNLEEIAKLGIPYIHLMPTDAMIVQSIQDAIDSVQLSMKNRMVRGLFLISLMHGESDAHHQQYNWITLQKVLVDYRLHNDTDDFEMQMREDRLELQCEAEDIRSILESGRRLVNHLKETTDLDFRVGIGIQASHDKVRIQAELALQEAKRYNKRDGFAVYGETGILVGPISLGKTLSYRTTNAAASEYCKKVGIDESNLFKIIGLYRMDVNTVLSASSLSEWLNITPRSCNRILQQLLDSNLIEEIEPEVKVGRGRPGRRYRFLKKNCELSFF